MNFEKTSWQNFGANLPRYKSATVAVAKKDRLFLIFLKHTAAWNNTLSPALTRHVFYRHLYRVFSILVCKTGLVKQVAKQAAKQAATSFTASYTTCLPLKLAVKFGDRVQFPFFKSGPLNPIIKLKVKHAAVCFLQWKTVTACTLIF